MNDMEIKWYARDFENMEAREMRIVTNYWMKPIPLQQFDWSAVTDNYEPGEPIGYGATEAEAIKDLQEQCDDNE
jgi:hypothetical protein